MKVVVKLIKLNIPAGQIIKNDRKIHTEVIDNVGTFYYKKSQTVKPDWVEDFKDYSYVEYMRYSSALPWSRVLSSRTHFYYGN